MTRVAFGEMDPAEREAVIRLFELGNALNRYDLKLVKALGFD